jgi:hypothetical protein
MKDETKTKGKGELVEGKEIIAFETGRKYTMNE